MFPCSMLRPEQLQYYYIYIHQWQIILFLGHFFVRFNNIRVECRTLARIWHVCPQSYKSTVLPPLVCISSLSININSGARSGTTGSSSWDISTLFRKDPLHVLLHDSLSDTPGLWVAQRGLSQQMTVTSSVLVSPPPPPGGID